MDPFDCLYKLYRNIPMYHPYYSATNVREYCPIQGKHYDVLRYIQQRNKEELLYKNWIRQRKDLEKNIQEKMEGYMKVRSGDNHVKFIYKYKGHEVLGTTIFRFKIILVYHSLLRKWYISPGYSFVPEVIDLKGKLKSGTYDPFSEEIFDIIYDVTRSIDVFMERLTIVYQFVHNAQKRYKDLQIAINAIVTKMELTFTENAWPIDIQKSSVKDTIVVELKLNKNIEVCNVAYKYMYQKARSKNAENLNKLQIKLRHFFYFPLEEAVEKFITEEESSTSS